MLLCNIQTRLYQQVPSNIVIQTQPKTPPPLFSCASGVWLGLGVGEAVGVGSDVGVGSLVGAGFGSSVGVTWLVISISASALLLSAGSPESVTVTEML